MYLEVIDKTGYSPGNVCKLTNVDTVQRSPPQQAHDLVVTLSNGEQRYYGDGDNSATINRVGKRQ